MLANTKEEAKDICEGGELECASDTQAYGFW